MFQNDDRRVLAAATYLIETRPDLLEKEKRAFLPRNKPANVGQYTRGRYKRIVMPYRFPEKMKLTAVGSKEEILTDFINSYNNDKIIEADWLVLASETATSGDEKSFLFYSELLNDPQITWEASFVDEKGRKLWLGEVTRGARVSFDNATVYRVGPLADIYTRKYDRFSFLRKDIKYVFHD
jgi:hypothetical protein